MSNANKAVKAEPVPVKKEAAYPLDTLRKDSVKLFNVTTSTFDGAMAGQNGPMTIARAREIIEAWKRGVVK